MSNALDRIWFITGISSGLGRETALAAADAGHTVVGTVRREAHRGSLLAPAPAIHTIVLDVDDHVAATRALNDVVQRYGRIDVLVNNAGYGITGAIEETSLEEVRAQFETNLFAVLHITKAVLPSMRANGGGRIIQISSQAGLNSSSGLGIYSASKHALEAISEALAAEVAHMGIHVSLVEPGPLRTNWAGANMRQAVCVMKEYTPTAGAMRERLAAIDGKQPGDPKLAAQAILALASMDKPPLRLALGAIALANIRNKVQRVLEDLAMHEALSLSTDRTTSSV